MLISFIGMWSLQISEVCPESLDSLSNVSGQACPKTLDKLSNDSGQIAFLLRVSEHLFLMTDPG
jgi:hypothetical protein